MQQVSAANAIIVFSFFSTHDEIEEKGGQHLYLLKLMFQRWLHPAMRWPEGLQRTTVELFFFNWSSLILANSVKLNSDM